jgi:ABC-type microcin C transport system permease subunit YejB
LLLGPSLLVWIVRGVAYAAQCHPGPELCQGMMLGSGLRDTLALAWGVSTNTFFLIAVSIAATLAAFTARRPLLGTLSLLLLPILALVLPMFAVLTAHYNDCAVNNDGIGNCTLWGAQMGMSFHTAATVPDIIYGLMPFSFSLTLMLGLLGFFFARPRGHRSPPHLGAQMRHFEDE